MSLKKRLQQLIYLVVDPFVFVIRKLGITPNNITTIGFVITLLACVYLLAPLYYDQKPEYYRLSFFGIIILFAGLMDILDGRMARVFNLQSIYGAFYDSVLDRYSELVMFLGLMGFFIIQVNWILIFLVFFSLCGSLMVSYTRARAEGLGIDCSVGLLQRPERIILVTFSCVLAGVFHPHFSDIILYIGLGIVAIFSNFTAYQRMRHVREQTMKLTDK